MSRHLIASTKNDKEVYANLMQAPLNAKVSRVPHLLTLVREIVEKRDLTAAEVTIEQDMNRTVGYSEVLPTTEKDAIFYARQLKTGGYTRFVKNRKTEATTFVTLQLTRDEAGNYELVNASIGKAFPPSPDSPDAPDDSKVYWEQHAVVYNGQPIIASSLTKDCPY